MNFNVQLNKQLIMKKFFYLMFLAIMPMCFTACGGDDDADNGGIDASIEGTWRIQSIEWSYYIKGGSIEPSYKVKEYDETTTQGLSITKKDGKFYITSTAPGIKGNFEQVGANDFRGVGSRDDIYQRLVIVGVNGNLLTVEFYEDYYESVDGQREEYGLMTFVRQ